MGMQIEHTIIWHINIIFIHGEHIVHIIIGIMQLDGIDKNLLTCMRKLWGSPHEQYWKHHMEKMESIQNNAYPKLGGHGMAYEINDAKGAYQYHHKKTQMPITMGLSSMP